MPKNKFLDNPRTALDCFITNLQSESKSTRKIALESINREIFENPLNSECDLTTVFSEVYAYILKSFSDNSEACRDVACTIISNFIDKLPLNDYYLTYIMPVLVRRIGSPEIVEESEELRLTLIILVHKIIEKYKVTQLLVPFMNDFCSILTKVSTDPFPKVKLEACECIILLSTAVQRDFHFQSESYVKPVLSNFTHQHFRVRVAAIKAIGAIVLAGTAKCFELSITPMAEKLFDETAQVRMQVTLEVGNWMLNLRDRYSFWHRMIPLLLTSLSDVMGDIRQTAMKLWTDVGLQFLEENEEDLKKRTDFLMDVPTHYPDVKRPNMGCRQLVQRNIGKIIPAIEREMDGWQADPRLRVAQLLCWLILCAEEGATQHAAAIIRVLHRGAKDDDERVINEVKQASKLLGYFITPDTWWPLLEADMDSWGALFVLANILTGSQAEQVQGKIMQDILKEIVDPDRCQTRKLKYQENLLCVVEALMDLCGEDCRPCARELFVISFTVYAIPVDDKMATRALSNLEKLRAIEGCGRTLRSLYARHVGDVLASITGDARTWTLLTAERCLLQCVLLNAGSAMGDQLHLIAPLLNDCLGTRDVDPEVKLKMFTTLSTVMMDRQINFSSCEKDKLQAFLKIIINDVIKPNLVWSPGRTAEAIRTAAVACLCSALQPPAPRGPGASGCGRGDGAGDATEQIKLFPDKETLENFLDEIIPLLTGLVDDNAALTRQHTLRTISHLAALAHQEGCFTSERLHKLYYPVLKRLDDSSDKVRSLALECVSSLFGYRPAPYDAVTFGAHVDALYSAMLVHLDDLDDNFRKEMLDALLRLSDVDPKLLEKKVKANIHLYRNKVALEQLAAHVANLKM